MADKRCTPWCTPLIIYIFFSLMYLIFVGIAIFSKSKKVHHHGDYYEEKEVKLSTKLGALFGILLPQLLGGLLYAFLCYRCWNTAAWIILLLPLIIIGIYLLFMLIFIGGLLGVAASAASSSKS